MSQAGDRQTGECFRWQNGDLLLYCKIQAGARCDELAGRYGDRLRLRIAAVASDGRANARLQTFLAKVFGVARRDVELLSGQTSRHKTVCIRSPRQLPPELGIAMPAAG